MSVIGVIYPAILLIGPPGSGKGTQGRILDQIPGYRLISMGQLLRALGQDTKTGRQVHEFLLSGELVPPELVISIWKQHVEAQFESKQLHRSDVLVLDGLPRTIEQAELLQPHIRIQDVIHLACDNDSLLKERIRNRQEERRDDENEHSIRHRFDAYKKQTKPLLEWYSKDSIIDVDASDPPLEVLHQIVSAVI